MIHLIILLGVGWTGVRGDLNYERLPKCYFQLRPDFDAAINSNQVSGPMLWNGPNGLIPMRMTMKPSEQLKRNFTTAKPERLTNPNLEYPAMIPTPILYGYTNAIPASPNSVQSDVVNPYLAHWQEKAGLGDVSPRVSNRFNPQNLPYYPNLVDIRQQPFMNNYPSKDIPNIPFQLAEANILGQYKAVAPKQEESQKYVLGPQFVLAPQLPSDRQDSPYRQDKPYQPDRSYQAKIRPMNYLPGFRPLKRFGDRPNIPLPGNYGDAPGNELMLTVSDSQSDIERLLKDPAAYSIRDCNNNLVGSFSFDRQQEPGFGGIPFPGQEDPVKNGFVPYYLGGPARAEQPVLPDYFNLVPSGYMSGNEVPSENYMAQLPNFYGQGYPVGKVASGENQQRQQQTPERNSNIKMAQEEKKKMIEDAEMVNTAKESTEES